MQTFWTQLFFRNFSVSKPLDTLIVFLKEIFEEVNFEKKSQQTTTKGGKIIQHAKSSALKCYAEQQIHLSLLSAGSTQENSSRHN